MSYIARIRLPSTWASKEDTGYRFGVADFKLGLGPCGKEVVSLDLRAEEHGFEVCQQTDDGEEKVFIYPHSTITGRIEVTMGNALAGEANGR